MASVKWEYGTLTTVITTGLNALADDANAISSAIDNSVTDSYTFCDVELDLGTFGYVPNADAVVEIYIVSSLDGGTTYSEGDASIDPPFHSLVGVMCIRAATTAQHHVFRQIVMPSCKFKFVIINQTGQAFAATGNTFSYRPYRLVN